MRHIYRRGWQLASVIEENHLEPGRKSVIFDSSTPHRKSLRLYGVTALEVPPPPPPCAPQPRGPRAANPRRGGDARVEMQA